MVKTALSRHFAAKTTPTQRFNSVLSSQLHVACARALQLIYTAADQTGVGSLSGLCLALRFPTQFFRSFSFTKLNGRTL